MIEKEVMIDKIDKSQQRIQENWNDIMQNDIKHIQDSWDDPLCEEYIKKIENTNQLVNKILNRLDVLKTCWEQYERKN